VSRRVHLIGVGGAGMSAIARILVARGVEVSGCDRAESATLAALREAGVDARAGHDVAHLRDGIEVGVSTAIDDDLPELRAARERGLPVLHRSELLAELVAGSDASVAVAGTHGKTTTSGMLAFVLSELGLDPTFLVGGDLPQLGTNARAGRGPLVAEADESDGSLARLRPGCAIVLNVELDHHDTFASLGALEALLAAWTRELPADGLLITGDGVELPSPAPRLRAGAGPGEGWRALEPAQGGRRQAFTLRRPGADDLRVTLDVPGRHNAANAAAALAALAWLGVAPERAAPVLSRFRGAGRRFEEHGEVEGVRLVDDYAHHPSEVAAVIEAARAYAGYGRLIACFQPHMPWRTRALQAEFAAALLAADAACVCELYVARGAEEPDVSGRLIVERALEQAPERPLAWTPTFEDAAAWLAAQARPGDVVLTMGAGPVDRIAELLKGGAR
jgi:UDP-N-acetylmuramate--alanine ligase